jgi:uncharacterized protein YejL (UPF0352 family)
MELLKSQLELGEELAIALSTLIDEFMDANSEVQVIVPVTALGTLVSGFIVANFNPEDRDDVANLMAKSIVLAVKKCSEEGEESVPN